MIKEGKNTLERFALVLFIGFSLFGLILFLRGKTVFYIPWLMAIVVILAGFLCPLRLNHLYKFWMQIASRIGWLNTRLILFMIYYLMFTPVGLMMRIFGMDFLDTKIDRSKASYWRKSEEKEFRKQNYERQF
ncbi:SxtJ family membrane protein [Candidatus Omnitrophota bacterium]